MEKLTEIFAMGGYGAYVWPSFIVAALAMAAMVIASLKSLKRARQALAEVQNAASNASWQ
jgi:heme exporter protein D